MPPASGRHTCADAGWFTLNLAACGWGAGAGKVFTTIAEATIAAGCLDWSDGAGSLVE